jgi:hypothetical protein
MPPDGPNGISELEVEGLLLPPEAAIKVTGF